MTLLPYCEKLPPYYISMATPSSQSAKFFRIWRKSHNIDRLLRSSDVPADPEFFRSTQLLYDLLLLFGGELPEWILVSRPRSRSRIPDVNSEFVKLVDNIDDFL